MSDIVATNEAAAARATNAALWVLQAVLAFQFAGGGLMKLGGAESMVTRLSGRASLGLAGLLVGATATNLFVLGESPWLPICLLLVSV